MWTTRLRVRNKGTGRMPLQIAVTRGERFPEDVGTRQEVIPPAESVAPALGDGGAVLAAVHGGPSEPPGAALVGTDSSTRPGVKPGEPYRESRALIELGAGEEHELVLTSDFEPQEVVVDPDALVLQLNRKHATKKLD
jgi:hypothetical protein